MFGDDSVFDFNPFDVGNWMTIGLEEEEQESNNEKNENDEEGKEECQWNLSWL